MAERAQIKPGVMVLVVKYEAAGSVGIVVEFDHVQSGWLVEFPRPIPCRRFIDGFRTSGTRVTCAPGTIIPITPGSNPEALDHSVVQPLANPLAQEVHS